MNPLFHRAKAHLAAGGDLRFDGVAVADVEICLDGVVIWWDANSCVVLDDEDIEETRQRLRAYREVSLEGEDAAVARHESARADEDERRRELAEREEP